jgi:hypothetical protein
MTECRGSSQLEITLESHSENMSLIFNEEECLVILIVYMQIANLCTLTRIDH